MGGDALSSPTILAHLPLPPSDSGRRERATNAAQRRTNAMELLQSVQHAPQREVFALIPSAPRSVECGPAMLDYWSPSGA